MVAQRLEEVAAARRAPPPPEASPGKGAGAGASENGAASSGKPARVGSVRLRDAIVWGCGLRNAVSPCMWVLPAGWCVVRASQCCATLYVGSACRAVCSLRRGLRWGV